MSQCAIIVDSLTERVEVLERFLSAAQTRSERFEAWDEVSQRLVQSPRPQVVIVSLDILSAKGVEAVMAADAQLKVMGLPSVLIFHIKDLQEAEALSLMANFTVFLAWPTEPNQIVQALNSVSENIAAEPEDEEEDAFEDFLNLDEFPGFDTSTGEFDLDGDPEIAAELDAFLSFDDPPEEEEEKEDAGGAESDLLLDDSLPLSDSFEVPSGAFSSRESEDDDFDLLDDSGARGESGGGGQSDPFAETHAHQAEITVRVPSLRHGKVSNVPVIRLLNYLHIQGRSGLLSLSQGRLELHVELREGVLIAREDNARHFESLKAAVGWGSGSFSFADGQVEPGGREVPLMPLLMDGIKRFVSMNRSAAEFSSKSGHFPHFTDQFKARHAEFASLGLADALAQCDGARPLSKLIAMAGADFNALFQGLTLAQDTDAVMFLEGPGLAPVQVRYDHTTQARKRTSSQPIVRPTSKGGFAPVSQSGSFGAPPSSASGPAKETLTPEQRAVHETLKARLERMESQGSYALFNLDEGCGEEAVEDRYFQMVRKHHPDRYASHGSQTIKGTAEAIFLRIQGAYARLLESEKGREPSGPSPQGKRPVTGGSARPVTVGSGRPSTRATRPGSSGEAPQTEGSERRSGTRRPVTGVGMRPPSTSSEGSRVRINAPSRVVESRRSTRRTPSGERSATRSKRPSGERPATRSKRPSGERPATRAGIRTPTGRRRRPSTGRSRAVTPTGERRRVRTSSQERPSLQDAEVPHGGDGDAFKRRGSFGFKKKPRSTRKVSELLGLDADGKPTTNTRVQALQENSNNAARPPSGLSNANVSPKEHYRNGLKFLEQKQPERAQKAFSLASQMEPDDGRFAAHLAWAQFLCDTITTEQAAQMLREARKSQNGWEHANVFLGRIAKQEGREDEARSYFEKVVERNPKHVEAMRELRLMNLRKEKKTGLFGRFFKKKK